MRLDNYTTDVFIENFKKDMEVFGEDTQAIYEEIFSTISGKRVKLDGFVDALNEGTLEEDTLEETPADDRMIIDYARTMGAQHAMSQAAEGINGALFSGNVPDSVKQQIGKGINAQLFGVVKTGGDAAAAQAAANLANAGKVVKGPSLLSKLGAWLGKLPAKAKAFFGGLKGKSFGEIMNKGLAWVQANPMVALKTTGGIAIVAMLIRALAKRRKLKEYPALYDIAKRGGNLGESFSKMSEFTLLEEETPEKIAMRKVIEECQTNKALNKLIFGEQIW